MPALVRFTMEYSYGDADDAWQEVALAVARSDAKLLVCDVAVAEVSLKQLVESSCFSRGGGRNHGPHPTS